jgi:hypothetical protein
VPEIDVTILAKGDPAPWEELADGKAVYHLPDATWHFAILDGGMQSGAPSVAFGLVIPDVELDPACDMLVMTETSLAALAAIVAAARGAFPEAFYDGPFDPRPLRTPGVN